MGLRLPHRPGHLVGVVWKVVPGRADRAFPGGTTLLFAILGTLALAAATVVVGAGRQRRIGALPGLLAEPWVGW